MNLTTRPPSASTTSLTARRELDEQLGQLGRGEPLGQRREARQVGESDAADHARRRVADDALEIGACADRVMPEDRVDEHRKARNELSDGAIRLSCRELVSAVLHLDVGQPEADRGRPSLGEPSHRRAEHPQQRQRRSVADGRLHRDPGRQAIDVDLAELRLVRVGDAQPERVPGRGELLERQAQLPAASRRV